jgi:hypothetical protein
MTLRRQRTTEIVKSNWQSVFQSSRVNGAEYVEPPAHHIDWPDSWIEKRLKETRKKGE